MNKHHHTVPAPPDDTVYKPPVLIAVGDAQNVVLGLPGGGDDQFGFSPWQFEFDEDNDEE